MPAMTMRFALLYCSFSLSTLLFGRAFRMTSLINPPLRSSPICKRKRVMAAAKTEDAVAAGADAAISASDNKTVTILQRSPSHRGPQTARGNLPSQRMGGIARQDEKGGGAGDSHVAKGTRCYA